MIELTDGARDALHALQSRSTGIDGARAISARILLDDFS